MSKQQTIAILEAIYENQQEDFKLSWEQTRYIAYIQAVSQGAKLEQPSDLVKFNWDNVTTNTNDIDEHFVEKELETLQWAKAALNINN